MGLYFYLLYWLDICYSGIYGRDTKSRAEKAPLSLLVSLLDWQHIIPLFTSRKMMLNRFSNYGIRRKNTQFKLLYQKGDHQCNILALKTKISQWLRLRLKKMKKIPLHVNKAGLGSLAYHLEHFLQVHRKRYQKEESARKLTDVVLVFSAMFTFYAWNGGKLLCFMYILCNFEYVICWVLPSVYVWSF